MVCRRLDNFQNVPVDLAVWFWTLSSSQFQAESAVNVLNLSFDSDDLWPNAFLAFLCILAPCLFLDFPFKEKVALCFYRLFNINPAFCKITRHSLVFSQAFIGLFFKSHWNLLQSAVVQYGGRVEESAMVPLPTLGDRPEFEMRITSIFPQWQERLLFK